MKISYSNYPVLKKLKKGFIGEIQVSEIDLYPIKILGSRMAKEFNNNSNLFKSHINIIRQSFYEACQHNKSKLSDLFMDIQLNDVSDFTLNGTFIILDFVIMFNFQTKKGDENVKLVLFIFSKDGYLLGYHSMDKGLDEALWINSIMNIPNNEESIRDWLGSKLNAAITISMFKTYADVETKFLKPKQRIKEIDCKYVNDTELDLTYLDCKWFTNLIKSDGFKVRGHFCLQPCGVGLKNKKLIWINDFDKNGYTSPARKTKINV